ncbi:uncharacterized protein ALTATR162_LOCUS12112 [Alternaria atra]|uniref:Uncharacterized protein n=1 Tax=Alternaria atra TaxID=119953 RepID=A0A8J2NC72_9PLEO|nr:uncharacterized protein ALTATR162_LOCUS12112 [Alternaria atra]CAG5189918.1 unnamed protein product [Alternaria atra]
MASLQQSQVLSHSKARRAANNNYSKLTQTLYAKLTKLCLEYNNHIYFLAYRNGRFNGFVYQRRPVGLGHHQVKMLSTTCILRQL